MKLERLVELVQRSVFLSKEKIIEFLEVVPSLIPHKIVERTNAIESLNDYETINYVHGLSEIHSLSGMQNMIETLNQKLIVKTDFVDEYVYFSVNKTFTIIILNESEVVGLTNKYKSEWHKKNHIKLAED